MHIDNIKYPIRVLGSQSLAEKNCVEKLDPYKIPIKIEHSLIQARTATIRVQKIPIMLDVWLQILRR